MPGKIISLPASAHKCTDLPNANTLEPATVWQCDECDAKWVIVEGAQYNVAYRAWRLLTELNADGTDNVGGEPVAPVGGKHNTKKAKD